MNFQWNVNWYDVTRLYHYSSQQLIDKYMSEGELELVTIPASSLSSQLICQLVNQNFSTFNLFVCKDTDLDPEGDWVRYVIYH